MFGKSLLGSAAALLLGVQTASAFLGSSLKTPIKRAYYPANATGVTRITSPSGATVAFKQPGKDGVCETTPGVNSYSGYVELAPDIHVFFWFFESRRDPAKDPITLWLNGGPGSDSLIGLFQELGPCNVTEDLKTQINPYSWNEVSNLLFLSQPVGVGFSYEQEEIGSHNPVTGAFEDPSQETPTGRYPVINASEITTTDMAAVATWHTLQGFLSTLETLDCNVGEVTNKEFNLWTESYGGHYGPSFFNYFHDQNKAIANGTQNGTYLNFNTLGIGNGIIDEYIQAPYYPEFAVNNTYGIKAVNDTVYNYMKFATNMIGGCLDLVKTCRSITNVTNGPEQTYCSEAQDMCRDNVEGPYYNYGGRGVYDIRHPIDDPTPPSYFTDYLNQAEVQQALGVNLNYTDANDDIYFAFQTTGDFVYGNFIEDINYLLDQGVRVALYYGDADYICNWFGGEAISLAVNYTHTAQFKAAGYQPFTLNGVEYGESRQYGNLSFTRIYEAGHEVPFYQPEASLALFNRTLNHFDVATGEQVVTGTLTSNGPPNATHTEPFVALPSGTSDTANLRNILKPIEWKS